MQTGALYIALVSLMAGRRPRRDTAIFGEVTDSGQLIGWVRSAVDTLSLPNS